MRRFISKYKLLAALLLAPLALLLAGCGSPVGKPASLNYGDWANSVQLGQYYSGGPKFLVLSSIVNTPTNLKDAKVYLAMTNTDNGQVVSQSNTTVKWSASGYGTTASVYLFGVPAGYYKEKVWIDGDANHAYTSNQTWNVPNL